jgi:hypothetical protein
VRDEVREAVSDDAYRLAYRVETHVRDLTTAEVALVDTRLREWNARVRRQAMQRTRELVYALPFAAVVVVVAAGRGWDGVVFAGGLMCFLFAMLLFAAWRQANATIAASRGPWHAPDGGWKIRDTRVVARSVVQVENDDEDHAIWVLFEVPGGEWFYVDAICLPPEKQNLAYADVRFTRLSPDGVYLDVDARGDAIPSRELPDAWKPHDEGADGTIAETALPPRILHAANGPR